MRDWTPKILDKEEIIDLNIIMKEISHWNDLTNKQKWAFKLAQKWLNKINELPENYNFSAESDYTKYINYTMRHLIYARMTFNVLTLNDLCNFIDFKFD